MKQIWEAQSLPEDLLKKVEAGLVREEPDTREVVALKEAHRTGDHRRAAAITRKWNQRRRQGLRTEE